MAKQTEKRVSLRPSEMVQGGLIDDIDVTFNKAEITIFDYQGKADPRVALRIEMEDDDENIHEQFFSAADPEHFAPSSDGEHIVATGEKTALNKGSNYAEFITSLINCGFPEPALDDGISVINGTKAHVARKPAPKRSGIINQAGEGGREKTVLEVTKLIALPDALKGKKGSKAAVAGKTNGKAKQQAAEDEDEGEEAAGGLDATDTKLAKLIKKAVAEADDETMTLADLVPMVFENYKGDDKKAATKRVAKAEFLKAAMKAGYFLYDADAQEVTSRE